jgi:hypothetical protein
MGHSGWALYFLSTFLPLKRTCTVCMCDRLDFIGVHFVGECPRFWILPEAPTSDVPYSTCTRTVFKETVQLNFCLWFVRNRFLLSHLLVIWRLFEFGFAFVEIFTIFNWLPAIIYSRESILPVLFNTESHNSTHRLIRSHRWQRRIFFKEGKDPPPALKGHQGKKLYI